MTSYTGSLPPAIREGVRRTRNGGGPWPVRRGSRCPSICPPSTVRPRSRVECVCGIARKVSGRVFSTLTLGTNLAHAQASAVSPGDRLPPWLCLWLTQALLWRSPGCGSLAAAVGNATAPTHACPRQLTRTSLAVRCYSCPMQARPPPSSAWRSGSRRSPRRARC